MKKRLNKIRIGIIVFTVAFSILGTAFTVTANKQTVSSLTSSGDKIAFTHLTCELSIFGGLRNCRSEIRVAISNGEVQLTEGESPSWSPDGSKILFLNTNS